METDLAFSESHQYRKASLSSIEKTIRHPLVFQGRKGVQDRDKLHQDAIQESFSQEWISHFDASPGLQ
jgi:hypothetical protein